MRAVSVNEISKLTGWSEKSLRNALEREHYAPREGKGATRYEFSLLDVCDAAIARRLVDVGFPIANARDQARAHVNDILGSAAALTFEDVASRAKGLFLEIYIFGDRRESNMRRIEEMGIFFEPPPEGYQMQFGFQDGSVLVLHLGDVFRRLCDKARDMFVAEPGDAN